MYRDDLDRYDTVYTRYLNMPESDDVLSNGKDATKANVEDILDDLQDDRTFGDGKWWDLNDEYDSDVLGEYSGVRGFVNQISDKIFGDLEEQDVDDVEDMRVGDMIYNDYYKVYGIVVSVNYNRKPILSSALIWIPEMTTRPALNGISAGTSMTQPEFTPATPKMPTMITETGMILF